MRVRVHFVGFKRPRVIVRPRVQTNQLCIAEIVTTKSKPEVANSVFSSMPFSILLDFLLRLAIWLILPVVIRLSQRLSHACLSINDLYCETANGSLNQL